MTTITNHHKLCGLKEKKFILSLSEGQTSEIKVSAGPGSLWGSLRASGGCSNPWCSLAHTQSLPLCHLLCVSVSSPLRSNLPLPHSYKGFRVHQGYPKWSYLEILNLMTPFFQIRQHSQIPEIRIWICLFGDHHSTRQCYRDVKTWELWQAVVRIIWQCPFLHQKTNT